MVLNVVSGSNSFREAAQSTFDFSQARAYKIPQHWEPEFSLIFEKRDELDLLPLAADEVGLFEPHDAGQDLYFTFSLEYSSLRPEDFSEAEAKKFNARYRGDLVPNYNSKSKIGAARYADTKICFKDAGNVLMRHEYQSAVPINCQLGHALSTLQNEFGSDLPSFIAQAKAENWSVLGVGLVKRTREKRYFHDPETNLVFEVDINQDPMLCSTAEIIDQNGNPIITKERFEGEIEIGRVYSMTPLSEAQIIEQAQNAIEKIKAKLSQTLKGVALDPYDPAHAYHYSMNKTRFMDRAAKTYYERRNEQPVTQKLRTFRNTAKRRGLQIIANQLITPSAPLILPKHKKSGAHLQAA